MWLGFEIGSQLSRVAAYGPNGADIVTTVDGARASPTCVAIAENGDKQTGWDAVPRMFKAPSNSFYDFKNMVGRKSINRGSHLNLQSFISSDSQGIMLAVATKENRQIKIRVEEFLAAMLTTLVDDACASFPNNLSSINGIITVPARFTLLQRCAIKDAGVIAGINSIKLYSDVSAVSVTYSYGREQLGSQAKTILFFDVGAVNVNIGLVAIGDGYQEMKALAGIDGLGGSIFDQRICEHFISFIQSRYARDVSSSYRAVRRLTSACEKAKRVLSASRQALVEVEELLDGFDFSASCTREELEEMCMDLFLDCIQPLDKLFGDAQVSKCDVDEVVLVGGSTRIPKIQELLTTYFDGKALNKTINPDESVVCGAAILAAQMGKYKLENQFDSRLEKILCIDALPYNLGIESKDDTMVVVLPRHLSLPAHRSVTVSLPITPERTVILHIYEGDDIMAKNNLFLERLVFPVVSTGEWGGTIPLEITFILLCDCTFTIRVTEVGTTNGAEFAVLMYEAGRMTPEELLNARHDLDIHRATKNSRKECQDKRNILEKYLLEVRSALSNPATLAGSLPFDSRCKLVEYVTQLDHWMSDNPTATIGELHEAMANLSGTIEEITCQASLRVGSDAGSSRLESSSAGPSHGFVGNRSSSSSTAPLTAPSTHKRSAEVRSMQLPSSEPAASSGFVDAKRLRGSSAPLPSFSSPASQDTRKDRLAENEVDGRNNINHAPSNCVVT